MPISQKILEHVGIGLRHQHLGHVLTHKPDVAWFEVHSENFFSPHLAASKQLEVIAKDYPLSAHSIGLSLGSVGGVDAHHLNQLAAFVERYQPVLLSDHISWGHVANAHLPDLLPLPYTEEAVDVLCRNIEQVQERLQRSILVENPSSYLQFSHSTMSETDFIVQVVKRSGCSLLLDINNIEVSCRNHGWDAQAYLQAIPREAVKEMHLAGYAEVERSGVTLLIDDHGAPVYDEVWQLYGKAVERFGPVATLIEWDTNLPAFEVLMAEAKKAERIVPSSRYVNM